MSDNNRLVINFRSRRYMEAFAAYFESKAKTLGIISIEVRKRKEMIQQ